MDYPKIMERLGLGKNNALEKEAKFNSLTHLGFQAGIYLFFSVCMLLGLWQFGFLRSLIFNPSLYWGVLIAASLAWSAPLSLIAWNVPLDSWRKKLFKSKTVQLSAQRDSLISQDAKMLENVETQQTILNYLAPFCSAYRNENGGLETRDLEAYENLAASFKSQSYQTAVVQLESIHRRVKHKYVVNQLPQVAAQPEATVMLSEELGRRVLYIQTKGKTLLNLNKLDTETKFNIDNILTDKLPTALINYKKISPQQKELYIQAENLLVSTLDIMDQYLESVEKNLQEKNIQSLQINEAVLKKLVQTK